MFSLFKKKDDIASSGTNVFLDVENAAFNTVSPQDAVPEVVNYQQYVYQPSKNDVPAYRASNTSDLGVVIDNNQFGFSKNDLNQDVRTVQLTPNEVQDEFSMPPSEVIEPQLISFVPQDDFEIIDIHAPVGPISSAIEAISNADSSTASAFQDKSAPIGPMSAVIEEISNTNDFMVSTPQQTSTPVGPISSAVEEISSRYDEELPEFSIFGSQDGPVATKRYTVEDYEEEPVELEQEVKLTPSGHKICPECGAILNVSAPVCFMCSKSFVLRR